MKNNNNASVSIRKKLNHNSALATAVLLLFGSAVAYGQINNNNEASIAAPIVAGTTNGTSVAITATNTPLGQIQITFDRIKTEIATTVAEMQKANSSTPAAQAQNVTKLASQLRELATNELADTSQIAANSDRLIAKMKNELAQARAKASDPNVAARQIYRDVADRLEPQVSKLIDARASLSEIRSQLLEKANSLDQDAIAIGFAADAAQDAVASEAFQKVLGDVAKFTLQIQNLIDSTTKIPLT